MTKGRLSCHKTISNRRHHPKNPNLVLKSPRQSFQNLDITDTKQEEDSIINFSEKTRRKLNFDNNFNSINSTNDQKATPQTKHNLGFLTKLLYNDKSDDEDDDEESLVDKRKTQPYNKFNKTLIEDKEDGIIHYDPGVPGPLMFERPDSLLQFYSLSPDE